MTTTTPAAPPPTANASDDLDVLAGLVQVTPSAAATCARKRYVVALKQNSPLFDLMLGGINFPKETGQWTKDGRFSARPGHSIMLSEEDVARVKAAASRTFLRYNYVPGVYEMDGSPKIMGATRVEASPPGMSRAVEIRPTDVPISECIIFRRIPNPTAADDDIRTMEIDEQTRALVGAENAKAEADRTAPAVRARVAQRARAAMVEAKTGVAGPITAAREDD